MQLLNSGLAPTLQLDHPTLLTRPPSLNVWYRAVMRNPPISALGRQQMLNLIGLIRVDVL